MPRSFFYYNNETGERGEHRDISGMSDGELFSVEYQMLLKCDAPWVVIDSGNELAMATLKPAL